MMIMVDELVNLYKIPNSITRQYNYEKILTMYNDTLQGKASYLGIIMVPRPRPSKTSAAASTAMKHCARGLRKGAFRNPVPGTCLRRSSGLNR